MLEKTKNTRKLDETRFSWDTTDWDATGFGFSEEDTGRLDLERRRGKSVVFFSSSWRRAVRVSSHFVVETVGGAGVDAKHSHEPFLPFPRPPLSSAARYASSMSPET